MVAYLFLLVAVLSRVLPHAGWWNFTAVGAALLYFGARRPWREMVAPVAALIATDVYLTTFAYHEAFVWQAYVATWAWYAAAIAMGAMVLGKRSTWMRAVAAALLGPTSFFAVSNFSVWLAGGMYPRTGAGLAECYAAGLPFYRNDLISTALALGAVLAIPALARRMQPAARPLIAE